MRYTYKALDRRDARTFLESTRRGAQVGIDSVKTKGSGPNLPESHLNEIERQLWSLRSNFPNQLRPRDPRGGKFEAEACEIVHRNIPRDDPAMLADPDFWTYLSVVKLRDLVEWRYGGRAKLENFGLGPDHKEGLVYRLWLRGELGFDPGNAQDPYRLAKMGDQDFWRSHVFRQSYGQCRNLVHALLRFQFDAGKPVLSTEQIRELAKRLRRLQANVIFETLSADEAAEIVEREAAYTKNLHAYA